MHHSAQSMDWMAGARMHFMEILALRSTTVIPMYVLGFSADSTLAKAIGSDFKGKISVVIYAAGIALACWQPWVAIALYTTVAVMWLTPDRRIEKAVLTK